MSLRPFRNIDRKTKVIKVGDVNIGDNPISVQSMTNTVATDVSATIINSRNSRGRC